MERTPTAASARVRPCTRAWNSSPSPRDAARLNGWSESSSSHRPAFSASNSERVRSTMSSSTAARSSWPVSSWVTWRRARERLTSRRARARTLAFRMSAPIAPAMLRRKASVSPSSEPPGSSSRISSPIRSPAARSVSWARAPSLRRLTMPGVAGSGIQRGGRRAAGSRRGSRAPGSCRGPRAPGRSPPRAMPRVVRSTSIALRQTAAGVADGPMPCARRRKTAASTSRREGAAVVRRQDVGRVAALGQQQLHVATPVAAIAACVDAIGRQPARIGPGAQGVRMDAEQCGSLGNADQPIEIIPPVARWRGHLLLRTPVQRMEVLLGTGERMVEVARQWAVCPVGTDVAPYRGSR